MGHRRLPWKGRPGAWHPLKPSCEEPETVVPATDASRLIEACLSVVPLHFDVVTRQLLTVPAQSETSMCPAPLPVTVTVAPELDASAIVRVPPSNEPSESPQRISVPFSVPLIAKVP